MTMQGRLPAGVAALVGRGHERAKVASLFADTRVVTLTGSGGCGKTRLAMEVARDVVPLFADGGRWVDLQGVSDPALVASAVGAAVGVHERPGQALLDTLAEQLRERHLLVVLDNCEHLVHACAQTVGTLSAACPQLHVLATSRVPLVVDGEATFDVPPLGVPGDGVPVSKVVTADSARLFEVRARQVASDFRIDDGNAAAVAEICRRLDGIPLAIELAAGRTRLLSPGQIAAGLSDRFRLLTGGTRGAPARQRTLEASLDWSFDLLDDVERLALARLAVFSGSFELDAAEAVLSWEGIARGEVLDLVAGLVEQSLVQVVERRGRARYRLLESVRVYARRGPTDLAATRDRHLAFYVELAARAQKGLTGAAPGPWMTRLAADVDDLRAAMDWAADHGDLRALVGLTEPIVRFWWEHGTSRQLHGRLHDAALAPGIPDQDRTHGLLTAAALAFMANDLTRANQSAHLAVEAARTAGDDGALACAVGQRAVCGALSGQADIRQVGADVEQAVHLAPRCAEPPLRAFVLALAGAALLHVRSIDDGCRLFEEAAEVCQANGLAHQLPAALAGPAMWSSWAARLDQQVGHAERAVELSRQVRRPIWEATGLTGLGGAAALRGDHGRARSLLSSARAVLLAHSLDDAIPGVWVRHWLALSAYASGDMQGARAAAEEIVRIGAGGGSRWDQAVGEWLLGALALEAGDSTGARTHLEAGRDLSTDTPFPFSLGRSQLGLAELAVREGDPDGAWELVHDGLALLHGYADRVGTAAALEQVADLLVAQGDPGRALRLLGAVQRFGTDSGIVPFPAEADRFERVLDSARAALPPDDAAASWAAGNELTLDEAVDYARRGRGERRRPQSGWASLTPVERDVVRLVADGHANAEIGRRLFMSVNTVKKHLSHVYAKLDVEGRADLAAQAARKGR